MSYQTVQQSDTSPTNKQLRLCSIPKRWFCSELAAPADTMFFHKGLQYLSQVALIGILAIYGCTSDDLRKQSKTRSQEKREVAVKPMHMEVGEASWYGPGFQGKETANGETFDPKDMTAAHPNLPMGTKAKMTALPESKLRLSPSRRRGPPSDLDILNKS